MKDGKITAVAAYVTKNGVRTDLNACIIGFHYGIIEEVYLKACRFVCLEFQACACVVKQDLRRVRTFRLSSELRTKNCQTGLRAVCRTGTKIRFHLCELRNEIFKSCAFGTYVVHCVFIRENRIEEFICADAVTHERFGVRRRGIVYEILAKHDVLIFLSIVVVAVYAEQPGKLRSADRIFVKRDTQRVFVACFFHVLAKIHQFVPRCGIFAAGITLCDCRIACNVVYKPSRLQAFAVHDIRIEAGTGFIGEVCVFRQYFRPRSYFAVNRTRISVFIVYSRVHVDTVFLQTVALEKVTLYDVPLNIVALYFVAEVLLIYACVGVDGVQLNHNRTAVKTAVFRCQRFPTFQRVFKYKDYVDNARFLFDQIGCGIVRSVKPFDRQRRSNRFTATAARGRTARVITAAKRTRTKRKRACKCQTAYSQKFLFHLNASLSAYFFL